MKRLVGVIVACMACGEHRATVVYLNFFYCAECAARLKKP